MIVILTYYSDGSGKPTVKFFPTGDNQSADVALYLAGYQVRHQEVEVYQVDKLEDDVVILKGDE